METYSTRPDKAVDHVQFKSTNVHKEDEMNRIVAEELVAAYR
jgi:hypothetical protein